MSFTYIPTIAFQPRFLFLGYGNEVVVELDGGPMTVCLKQHPSVSSEEIGKIDLDNMRRRGQTPKVTIGPNMRAMGIESFEQLQEMSQNRQDFPSFSGQTFASSKKVGRNDPCPCGSGKKYKHCCGR